MDPLTAVLLFVMAVLWLIRRGAEDITAMVTGKEAPRLVRMRERRALNRLTVTDALTVRIARRIAQGKDPNRRLGPLRLYMSELWADSWEDVRRGHERRRRRRLATHQAGNPQPQTPDPDDNTEILDAEVIDPDHDWVWLDDHQPEPPLADPPVSDPVQEPTREEPSMPKQSTVTVTGEVTSPREALAWADSNVDTNELVKAQLQYLISYLKGAKLGPAALATVGAVLTSADGFTSAARSAQGVYAEHVLIHQDLSSDPALRDTLIGYLDAAKV